MEIDNNFWNNKKVFITGHTGFKGSWMCVWLHTLGAKVTGYALPPPTKPSIFKLAKISKLVNSITGDVRDLSALKKAIGSAKPDIVFHLAAQPLVRDSYKAPIETYQTNVLGTANILEAIRLKGKSVRAFVNVTTDKVYENREWFWGYREMEPLGGYDPYSNSKACSELITAAYRSSFFNTSKKGYRHCAIATARAGNVIGGGDWATDRIIPDCFRAILSNAPIIVRNPQAIRPWQHVLEPLSGYLLLGKKLFEEGFQYAESWNFGPDDADAKKVEWVVKKLCEAWGHDARYKIRVNENSPHEATFLKLDCSKSKAILKWYPRWNIVKALEQTILWTKAYKNNEDIVKLMQTQIEEYCGQ